MTPRIPLWPFLAFALVACGAPPEGSAQEVTETTAEPIHGPGTKTDAVLDYPAAALVDIPCGNCLTRHCSGTFVARDWLLTAAHCLPSLGCGQEPIYPNRCRGGTSMQARETLVVRSPYLIANGATETSVTVDSPFVFFGGMDLIFVYLSRPIADDTRIPNISITDFRQTTIPGTKATAVGRMNGADDITDGTLSAPVTLGGINGVGLIYGQPEVFDQGDSGGGLYLNSQTVLGVASKVARPGQNYNFWSGRIPGSWKNSVLLPCNALYYPRGCQITPFSTAPPPGGGCSVAASGVPNHRWVLGFVSLCAVAFAFARMRRPAEPT